MRKRSGFGIAELILGILLVISGIFTYFNPYMLLRWIVVVYGVIAVVTGISDIVFYVKTTRYTGFGPFASLIMGIISTMAGFMLIIYPDAGSWLLVLIFPIWIIAHSISRLCHLNEIKPVSGGFRFYFSLVLNILGIILGVLMIFIPSLNYAAAGFVLGTSQIVMGADLIINAAEDIRTGC